MTKHSAWEILFYCSLLVLLIWLILKLTGVINTPLIVEVGIPIITVILAFFSLYRDLAEKVHRLGEGFARMDVRMQHLESDVHEIKRKK